MFGQDLQKPSKRTQSIISANQDNSHRGSGPQATTYESSSKTRGQKRAQFGEKNNHTKAIYRSGEQSKGNALKENIDNGMSKVNFRGGRPFGQISVKTRSDQAGGKTGIGSWSKSDSNGERRVALGGRQLTTRPIKQKLLQQSNTRVNFVKELIREEATARSVDCGPPPNRTQLGSVDIDAEGIRGSVRSDGPVVDKSGRLTINLYIQPDLNEKSPGQRPSLADSKLNVPTESNTEESTSLSVSLGSDRVGTGTPLESFGSTVSQQTSKISRGQDYMLLASKADGGLAVGSRASIGFSSPRRAAVGIDEKDRCHALDDGTPHDLPLPATNNSDHVSSPTDHLATRQRVGVKINGDLNEVSEGRDKRRGECSPDVISVGLNNPSMNTAMANGHQYKFYPGPDHRTQFEQRLDRQIQQEIQYGTDPEQRIMDSRFTAGRATPEHLLDISAKHYLSKKNRLNSRESLLSQPSQLDNTRNMKSVHTNTGMVQYILRNRNKRDGSSLSSISGANVDHDNHFNRNQSGTRMRHTKIVRESDTQTDLKGDDVSDFEELLPPTQEVAIQTRKPPKSEAIEEKETVPVQEPISQNVEIGIQVSEEPKSASTQTEEIPKTVSTSTDDLYTSITNKSPPKSPELPQYKSQSMYKDIRAIIDDENEQDNSGIKPNSGLYGEKLDRYETFKTNDSDTGSLLDDLENEIYVLYLLTESGAAIGPLKLEIDDATFCGPDQDLAEGSTGNPDQRW